MKRYFYNHPVLFALTLGGIILLPFLVCLIGLGFADDSAIFFGIGMVIFGGLGCFILWRLLPLFQALDDLDSLRHARTAFFTGHQLTRKEAEDAITEQADGKRMKHIQIVPTGKINPIGIWQKKTVCLTKDPETLEEYSYHSLNYLLYSTATLDRREWDKITRDAAQRLSVIRSKNQKEPKLTSTVAAVCILADKVESEIAKLVLKPQKFTVSDVCVCAAEVPSDRWYACASYPKGENAFFSRAGYSRRLLGKITFNGFPYKNNELYTEEYLQTFEELAEKSILDMIRKAKADQTDKEDAEETKKEAAIFDAMQEGEVRVIGEDVYMLYKGYHVTAALYLPEEAEKEIRESNGDEERNETLKDIMDDLDGQAEYVPTVPADYRGAIVLPIPTLALEPRLKMFNHTAVKQIALSMREHLLQQGYEKVTFWDTDKDTLTDSI